MGVNAPSSRSRPMLESLTKRTTAAARKAVAKPAVARLERRIAAEKSLQSASAKGKVRLQAHAESVFLHTPNAKGTVMLCHGFTAGPWQYEELAKRLQKEGYNVYAPRMPGHGFARPDGQITGEY